MFDPTVGRWLEEDPEGFDANDPNFYRYVKNSPTNATDPSGLQEYKPIGETDPKKIHQYLLGVNVRSKDNFGPYIEKTTAIAIYEDFVKQFKVAQLPVDAIEVRVYRPQQRTPVGGFTGLFILDTLEEIERNLKREHDWQKTPDGVHIDPFTIALDLGQVRPPKIHVYIPSTANADHQAVCHSISLGVGGPGAPVQLIIAGPEADRVFHTPPSSSDRWRI
jgi:hypothetical protein